MITIVDSLCIRHPVAQPTLFVDDLTIEVVATMIRVISALIDLGLFVRDSLTANRMEVSSSKCNVAASTPTIGTAIQTASRGTDSVSSPR